MASRILVLLPLVFGALLGEPAGAAGTEPPAKPRLLVLTVKPGDSVRLSAAGSRDPEEDTFETSWLVYREAGSFAGEVELSAVGESASFVAPAMKQPETIHVILQLKDNGTPNLFACRRAVVTVQP